WATDTARGANQYTFANSGVKGNDGDPGKTDQHPVTNINWRDALVWCNALTEWYNAENGTSYACVYTSDEEYDDPIRTCTDSTSITASTDGSQDKPYINPDAKGFRLPTLAEWSCAARYKGSDSSNDAYEYPADSGNYWTPGDYASGADADYNDATETGKVAWYSSNSSSSTHVAGTAGNGGGAVRSGNANALGLFDVSGNVREWNFDWHPSHVESRRMIRGGSWSNSADYVQVGSWGSDLPYLEYSRIGFRFTRTQ
ncbi:MAG: formylglycine-generating enzyme family protein, partial [Spirochaetota bacterium]